MAIQTAIANNKVQIIIIDAELSDQRLDNFLLSRLKGVPRSRIYRLIRKGEVRINKKRIKPLYRLQTGDSVRIPPVRCAVTTTPKVPSQSLTARLEASVLYEDAGLIIINKPAGIAVHGGSGISLGVIEAFRQIRPRERILELVHRLDRDTSGCLMIAKKPSILRELHALLREGRLKKTYHALVKGAWVGGKQRVTAPLRKNVLRSGERIVRVEPDGKPSATVFLPLKRFEQATLVEARPETGRTHQIRVHAQYLKHAIVGDDKYGDDAFNQQLGSKRLMLHACALSFTLESREQTIQVMAPCDQQWDRCIKSLVAGLTKDGTIAT